MTAGIDGALTVAALLRGEQEAQGIQLGMQYAPDPPFQAGDPKTAPPAVLEAACARGSDLLRRRTATAQQISRRLRIT